MKSHPRLHQSLPQHKRINSVFPNGLMPKKSCPLGLVIICLNRNYLNLNLSIIPKTLIDQYKQPPFIVFTYHFGTGINPSLFLSGIFQKKSYRTWMYQVNSKPEGMDVCLFSAKQHFVGTKYVFQFEMTSRSAKGQEYCISFQ